MECIYDHVKIDIVQVRPAMCYTAQAMRRVTRGRVNYCTPCSSFIFRIINHSSFSTWSLNTFSNDQQRLSPTSEGVLTESIYTLPRDERDDFILVVETVYQ
jgi:hypothetical protein